MEWVIRERPYRLGELEYSYLLEFTVKINGISQGEKLFTRVPEEFQNELLYNNLVIACLGQGVIRLALEYMKKMRELGYRTSHLVYNRLIIRNSAPGRRKLIAKDLALMKADKAIPHVSTYHILMKLEANEHNIDGILKAFESMKKAEVEPNEVSYCILAMAHAVARLYTVAEAYTEEIEKSITGDNWSTLDILMILYGRLGKEKELERAWNVVKGFHHVRSKSYLLATEAFARVGNLDRAEELWLEMKTVRGLKETEQFNSLLSVYCKSGLIEKAIGVFREEVKNAKYNRYAFVYNTLFKAYVKGKVYDPNLFKRMVLGGARPDAESYSLLKLVEQFKP